MFTVGECYKRQQDIHDRYGGNRQSGISPCAGWPYVFLFSSPRGEEYGYRDGWISEHEYLYTGEGQEGNMDLVRGNRAVYEHEKDNRELHLFEKAESNVYRYLGRFRYVSHRTELGKDAAGHTREMIVFRLHTL